MMLIAQLSDTHVQAPSMGDEGFDNNAWLERAIVRLNELRPRPDLVLITGDLTNLGLASEYREFARILERLEVPCYVTIGNHDSRETMLAGLGDEHAYLRQHLPFIQYTIEDHPVRIVALDSTDPGLGFGVFCEQRLQWLAARLAEAPDRPTLLAIHHPPFRTGIVLMDASGTGWARELNGLIARHTNIVRVTSGHVHRSIQALAHGTLMNTCPTTTRTVHLDLDPEVNVAEVTAHGFFELEPPSFQLHWWNGASLVTHTAPIERFARSHPLSAGGIEWIKGKFARGENISDGELEARVP